MAPAFYSRKGKTEAADIIIAAISRLNERFTKADLARQCPSLTRSELDSGLKQLVVNGYVCRYGTGRSTFYTLFDRTKI